MSIWNDEWCCIIHITSGNPEGNKYYFPTKEDAERFRRSIVTEKEVEACYIVQGDKPPGTATTGKRVGE